MQDRGHSVRGTGAVPTRGYNFWWCAAETAVRVMMDEAYYHQTKKPTPKHTCKTGEHVGRAHRPTTKPIQRRFGKKIPLWGAPQSAYHAVPHEALHVGRAHRPTTKPIQGRFGQKIPLWGAHQSAYHAVPHEALHVGRAHRPTTKPIFWGYNFWWCAAETAVRVMMDEVYYHQTKKPTPKHTCKTGGTPSAARGLCLLGDTTFGGAPPRRLSV